MEVKAIMKLVKSALFLFSAPFTRERECEWQKGIPSLSFRKCVNAKTIFCYMNSPSKVHKQDRSTKVMIFLGFDFTCIVLQINF